MRATEGDLQHPRRSLGNRHRAQAEKFLRMASEDTEREEQHIAWAEQSARQSILHDFSNELNWILLIDLKSHRADSAGIHTVLEDLFTVLGRDPERLTSLAEADLVTDGPNMLRAAFELDPLDPDEWWESMGRKGLEDFSTRMLGLDLRDPRANILFGRRLERVISAGEEDLFIRLATHLLSHRPTNHEAWMVLGRLHERRKEYDEAWLCYDQAQTHFESIPARDSFRDRMIAAMDSEGLSWSEPDLVHREEFLHRLQSLAERGNSPEERMVVQTEEADEEDLTKSSNERERLEGMIQSGQMEAAYFLARRLVARGENWATEHMELTKGAMR